MEDYKIEKNSTENSTTEDINSFEKPETDVNSYGAVYTPNSDGNGYACKEYNAERKESKIDSSVKNSKNEKKRSSVPIVFLAITVAVCVLFSGAVAFGAAFLMGNLVYFQDISEDTGSTQNPHPSDITNNVYIDNSPKYSEETVVKEEKSTQEEYCEIFSTCCRCDICL